ncbi:Glucan endo-1,3-beta-glucosidase 2 [Hibiscus syriacus]|uniref:glucan endo-1,3-beta-D-glucosidase n=1 Tax=Hibiscus syriacus TaxID=106335 RepID=A0A6A2ZHQ6_HIBSY|nr:Glucan endo-1,3-beta-glucosidase 2 [Hibiscus syriacus]
MAIFLLLLLVSAVSASDEIFFSSLETLLLFFPFTMGISASNALFSRDQNDLMEGHQLPSVGSCGILGICLFEEAFVGVNIGTDLSDVPSPTQVVALLKSQNVRHVRLYDADRAMLLALANTGIQVIVSVPNELLVGIGQSNATAANWVARNIIAHVPATNITAIAVGSEVLTTLPNAAPVLVSALKFIHSALGASNLDSQIKVSTPHSSSIILDSFPPSQAFFNRSLDPFMVPLLKFLQSTGSYLVLNVYPYDDYMQSDGVIPLDYALFRSLPPNKEAMDANHSCITLTNLIKHVINNTGTPKHPGITVSAYIYELYNEDLRPGLASEQNWGLFDANGVPVYALHLSGGGTVFANDTTNQAFCVAKEGADLKMLQAALDWACGPGKVDCSPLLQGKPCYEPDNVVSHSTYAFNAYFQLMGKSIGTCDFKGVATITTTDPSHGSCVFPGSFGKNGTITNGTSLAPSSNDISSGCTPHYFYVSDSLTSFVIIGACVFLVTVVFL